MSLGARVRGALIGLIVPVVIIAAWQLAKSLGALSYQNIPSPWQIAKAYGTLISDGELTSNLGHTLLACLGGWAIGSAIGVVLGVGLGISRVAWIYSMASVEVLRAIPAIAFIPIAVIIFTQTLRMEISIATWVAIWPVVVSTMNGVASVTPEHHDVARSLQLGWLERVTKLALPTAMPQLLVALRLSLSGALVLAIVAEIVGNPAGVGYALVSAQQSLRPDEMFAYVLLTGIVGLVLNGLLSLIYRSAAPGVMARMEGSGHGA